MDMTSKEFAEKFTGLANYSFLHLYFSFLNAGLKKKANDFGSGRPVADLSEYRLR